MHNIEDAGKKQAKFPPYLGKFGLFYDVLCETGNNFIGSLDGSSTKVLFRCRLCKELQPLLLLVQIETLESSLVQYVLKGICPKCFSTLSSELSKSRPTKAKSVPLRHLTRQLKPFLKNCFSCVLCLKYSLVSGLIQKSTKHYYLEPS